MRRSQNPLSRPWRPPPPTLETGLPTRKGGVYGPSGGFSASDPPPTLETGLPTRKKGGAGASRVDFQFRAPPDPRLNARSPAEVTNLPAGSLILLARPGLNSDLHDTFIASIVFNLANP